MVALMLLAMPPAAAEDPLNEPVCDEAVGCVGVGACAASVCIPRVCDPSVECGSDLAGARSVCADNASIDGVTCSTSVGANLGTRRQTSAPVVGEVGENRVGVALVATDGHVFASHLPNAWIAPGVEAHGAVAGRDLGRTSAGAYRSDIQTDGTGRLPDTEVTSAGHQFSTLALQARHDGGPAGDAQLVVGLVLLDLAPEGCFARASHGIREVTCPRVSALP